MSGCAHVAGTLEFMLGPKPAWHFHSFRKEATKLGGLAMPRSSCHEHDTSQLKANNGVADLDLNQRRHNRPSVFFGTALRMADFK
jgi:hypothetical protein